MFHVFSLISLLIFSPSDIDPVILTPDQPQVVMLGDKVEWQCKTKASAAHTLQWMKVRAFASSPWPFMDKLCASKNRELCSLSHLSTEFFLNIPR